MNNSSALVVFSGGQDSTTCLWWAKKHFSEVSALSFVYGQKHLSEIGCARAIADKAGVPLEIMELPVIGRLGKNSLTDTSVPMDEGSVLTGSGPIPMDGGLHGGGVHGGGVHGGGVHGGTIHGGGVPNTFVPGRNLFFLSVAAVKARELGINHIVTGVSQTDFSGYPDCRDTFIKSLNVTLNLAMDAQFVIHTPLMWLDKAETWKMADELGIFDIVRNETVTCYNGIPGDGCGHCPSCRLRREGLEKYLKEKYGEER